MENKDDVIIRSYQPDDDKNIVKLLIKTFPKWSKYIDPLGLWRWKYIDTPLRTLITVAVVNNKIIGCNHALVYNAKLGSEITTLGYSDDLAVDIDFRGMGIWTQIRESREETFATLTKYSFSTTSNPIVIKSWVKRKESLFPFSVTRMMKTHDINYQLLVTPMKHSSLVKIGYYALKTVNSILRIFRTPIKRLDRFQITRITQFDERIDSLWMKIKEDYKFILEKKHQYLNWRFQDNDRGNHIILQATSGDEVLGYAVVGFKPGQSEGQLEDLLALKDRLDVADTLIDHACRILEGLGVNTIFYQVVIGHPYQALSLRHGFVDTRSRPYISFDYLECHKRAEVVQLKDADSSKVYFSYATTI